MIPKNGHEPRYDKGTDVAFYSSKVSDAVVWKIETFNESADTYGVRVKKTGQMTQVRADSCYSEADLPRHVDLDSEAGIQEARMYIDAFKDSRGEARKSDDGEAKEAKTVEASSGTEKREETKNFKDYAFETLAFAFVVSICVLFLWIGWAFESEPVPEPPKPKTETEILAEELNRLNTESIPDAGACARNEARNARKSEILKKLNYFK